MFRVSVSATVTGLAFVGVACVLFPNLTSAASASAGAPHAAVAANDNRTPSGRMEDGTLNVALRAGRGTWQPEGTDGPRLAIEAFGEGASPLMVPAPLIRAVAGTTIDVSVRNDVDGTLQVHGLCARSGTRCGPLSVSPGETVVVRFRIDQPGTYHYWATTIGAPVPFRELAGALVIDPPGAVAGADRVLVITEWTSLTPAQVAAVMRADDPGQVFASLKPRLTFVINGLSWPATERLTYRLGETARWRVINLSSQAHPMHLHGFYFDVESLGDGFT
jgi:FtsP/CotA-like multicopper oxidase with cupredoxin domain